MGSDMLKISSEHRLRSENLPFDIDVWYPLLEPLGITFKTIFIPLELQHAEAIVAYYRTRYQSRDQLDRNHIHSLLSLENEVKQLLSQHFPNSSAFVRLCGRSPKDGDPLNRLGVVKNYNCHLSTLLAAGEPDNGNTKLKAIANVNLLEVKTAEDVMNLLLSSERVFTDLHDWLKWGEPEQIALRAYEPEISLDYEFRAFVCRNKVTAISQYDHYGVYSHLALLKGTIQDRILQCWESFHGVLRIDSYCADFIYFPSSDTVKVVEISPFLPCTGPAMFKWKEDAHVLHNGPLEFRLNEHTHPHLDDLVEVNWEDRWAIPEAPFWKTYERYGFRSRNFLSRFFLRRSIRPPASPTSLLFVYGTLKRNFHWHQKFLSRAEFVCSAITKDPHALVLGESGVPYLLDPSSVDASRRKNVRGEVYRVTEQAIKGLDEYEGVNKDYYSRVSLSVVPTRGVEELTCLVYFKRGDNTDLKDRTPLEEYTLEMHQENYSPIRHIQVKQELYLNDLLSPATES